MPSAKRLRNGQNKEESSAGVVASNADLLTELLLRLPVKSLLKFKFVCKQWRSVIADPRFVRRKSLRPNAVSALCCSPGSLSRCQLLPLDGSNKKAALKYLNFAGCHSAIQTLRSCNGLFLCRVYQTHTYLVCNPSTKRFKSLPPFGADTRVLDINLAFDPSISQFYKVVCISGCKSVPNGCQILVYSSENGRWRASGDPFTAPPYLKFGKLGAAYWNGAIHWVTRGSSTLLYYDVNEEILREMAMPPPNSDRPQWRELPYFGESGGHLHVMDFYKDLTTQFTVYEMERDRSGWFVKFVVDFNRLAQFDPPRHPHLYLVASHKQPPLNVLCVVRGEEEEEESCLVVYSNEQKEVIRYNFGRQTHEKMGHFRSDLLRKQLTTFQLVESLSLL